MCFRSEFLAKVPQNVDHQKLMRAQAQGSHSFTSRQFNGGKLKKMGEKISRKYTTTLIQKLQVSLEF